MWISGNLINNHVDVIILCGGIGFLVLVFRLVFFNMLFCTEAAESQVDTTQISRTAP